MKKEYTVNDFKRILIKNGYILERTKGSHAIYCKEGVKPICVPVNKKQVNRMMATRLIKENCIIM